MQPDTRQLFRIGLFLFLSGVVAALLALTVCGGIGRQGPHTNSGWMALMVAMGCLPLGTLTLALALAKLAGRRKR
jgi:cytochrome c oxidase assembly factor CtaG